MSNLSLESDGAHDGHKLLDTSISIVTLTIIASDHAKLARATALWATACTTSMNHVPKL